MPKYDSRGFTREGFHGEPWSAKVGDRVVLRNNHHRIGFGWTVVGIKPWSTSDFPDPILSLMQDNNGTIIPSSSRELVKEDVWQQYYGKIIDTQMQ